MIGPRDIIEARNAGELRYAVVSDYSGELGRVLGKCGLTLDATLLIEHDRDTAIAILAALLEKDMAYEGSLMSEHEAKQMAADLVAAHATSESRYYSNGNWAKRESWNPLTRESWNPLTESTFDAGLLVTAPKNMYFCIWFQDED